MKICFIGDIMLSENQLKHGYVDKACNPRDWFNCVCDAINENDIIIGNFETTINDKEKTKGFPKFNSPAKWLKDVLSKIKFDILALANNHCTDTGEHGIINTIKEIEKNNVKYIGAYKDNKDRDSKYPLIINKDNIKIGLLNYCEKLNNDIKLDKVVINKFDIPNICKDILELKGKCDQIFCFLHFGEEYSKEPSNDTKEMMRTLIENGIDHVICSHTHTPQYWENYNYDGKNHFIIYSLGNFISDQKRLFLDSGQIAVFEIENNDVTLNIEKIFVTCPDFNDIEDYRVLFANQQLNKNLHNFSPKEIYKMNTLK